MITKYTIAQTTRRGEIRFRSAKEISPEVWTSEKLEDVHLFDTPKEAEKRMTKFKFDVVSYYIYSVFVLEDGTREIGEDVTNTEK